MQVNNPSGPTPPGGVQKWKWGLKLFKKKKKKKKKAHV